MENKASRRDQTLLACAAQEAKLLPPPEKMSGDTSAKEKMRRSTQGFFQDEPSRDRSRKGSN